MDIECQWPGSVHDAKMFANSAISHKRQGNKLPGTYQSVIPGHSCVPNYLIGDPAYPLTPFCLKEDDSCKTMSKLCLTRCLGLPKFN